MRLLRFNAVDEPVSRARTGVLLAGDIAGDLRAGYAACLVEQEKDVQGREIAGLRIPPDVRQILHAGRPAREAIERAATWLAERYAENPDGRGADGEALFVPLSRARLHNPLKPGRLIVVERNVRSQRGAPVVRERSPASVMGPVRDVAMPVSCDGLAYGTGLAIVMGKACHSLKADDALDAVAGYMVANEIHEPCREADDADLAGDVLFRRCIIGPYLVDLPAGTRALRLTTRVNGVTVQEGTTAALDWPVGRLIARLSRHGLEAGDVIVTGLLSDSAPAGSATVPRLQDGDLLESEIEHLGVMRNRVAGTK
ncbi:MAG: fumarylacetoacetate hydrolase family protein [Burkholderiales bacterium]|nr:fumarylacetoacetate hydrolase family protein [Burkholderiales bacterium]